MAMWYRFEMSSNIDAAQAKAQLEKALGAEVTDDGKILTPELSLSLVDITPGRDTELIEESFHFVPTLGGSFRHLFNENEEDLFSKLMLRASMWLLRHGTEAVLLFNGEIIVFQRIGAHLVFNADYKLWDDELLKQEVPFPFETLPLRSPLL